MARKPDKPVDPREAGIQVAEVWLCTIWQQTARPNAACVVAIATETQCLFHQSTAGLAQSLFQAFGWCSSSLCQPSWCLLLLLQAYRLPTAHAAISAIRCLRHSPQNGNRRKSPRARARRSLMPQDIGSAQEEQFLSPSNMLSFGPRAPCGHLPHFTPCVASGGTRGVGPTGEWGKAGLSALP